MQSGRYAREEGEWGGVGGSETWTGEIMRVVGASRGEGCWVVGVEMVVI